MGDSEESSFSKITSDFILLNVGDAISKVSLFVATVYLAKTLGVDNFGVYSFVQSFILVFMLMTDLGIEWNGVGQIAQHRLQADFQDYFLVYFNKVISTRIILALIAFGVIVITCVFLEIARMHAMLFIGFGLSVLISAFLAEWVLVGIGAFRLLVLYRIIRSLLYLGMTVFLITGPTALWKAGFVYTFSLFAESIGILYFLKKTYKWKCTVPKRETGAIKFIAESLPYFTYTLLSQIFFIVCILLARYIADDNATGLYSAAYRVISLVIPLGVYFVSAIYPHVLSATADKVQELFSMFFLRMIVLSVPISISFIALSEQIILRLYGEQYLGAGRVLILFAVATPVIFICLYFGAFLNKTGKEKVVVKAILYPLLVMPLVSYVGDRYVGNSSIALSLVAAASLCALIMLKSVKHLIKLSYRDMVTVMSAAGIMWAITWFIGSAGRIYQQQSLFLVMMSTAVSMCFYFGVLYILGINPFARDMLKSK